MTEAAETQDSSRQRKQRRKTIGASLFRSISMPKFPTLSKASFAKSLFSCDRVVEVFDDDDDLTAANFPFRVNVGTNTEIQACETADAQTTSISLNTSAADYKPNPTKSTPHQTDSDVGKVSEKQSAHDKTIKRESTFENAQSASSNDFEADVSIHSAVQMHGMLLKQVGSLTRTIHGNHLWRWAKRFAVLKEGFLFQYPESAAKSFEQTKQFNTHPKAALPIGECEIEPLEYAEQKFGIVITNAEFKMPIILAATSKIGQEQWIAHLREAAKVTLANCQLGETMIRALETQGQQLHQERQKFVDRLQSEANALREEIDRNEELERLKSELETEKAKLEETTKELKHQLDGVKTELDTTTTVKETLENEKRRLSSTNEKLQGSLWDLEKERLRILQTLSQQEREKQLLSKENTNLSRATKSLKSQLSEIESQTLQLLNEKIIVEEKLQENEHRSIMLEEEKEFYSIHAKELMSSLNDLAIQKEMTEMELKEEIMARINAEKQLRAAEKALEHLELALRLSGASITEGLKDCIMPDVWHLRKFFEQCAEEAKLDANRPIIMKNAVYARKSFLRKCKHRLRNSFRQRTAKALPTPSTIHEENDRQQLFHLSKESGEVCNGDESISSV